MLRRAYIRGTYIRILAASCISVISVFALTGCGHTDPYATGESQFTEEIPATPPSHAKSDWVVYVAPGTVTTGWLWFKKETPVLYTEVDYLGKSTIRDVVIHFGDKTVTSPQEGQNAGLEFYLKTARLPASIDISWKVNGQSRNVKIGSQAIPSLPWVDG